MKISSFTLVLGAVALFQANMASPALIRWAADAWAAKNLFPQVIRLAQANLPQVHRPGDRP